MDTGNSTYTGKYPEKISRSSRCRPLLYTRHGTIVTLKALKAMGYEDFETFGFDSKKGTYYGYKASEFKKILEDLQITASSGHYGFSSYLDKPNDDLNRFVDQCIVGALTLDMKYITWPWIAPEQRTIDNFKLMSGKLNCIIRSMLTTDSYHADHRFR